MFTNFNVAERKVHFPDDRRMFIGVKALVYYVTGLLLLATVGAAWLQYLCLGLPKDPSLAFVSINPVTPSGFPWWICLSHWVNFFFLVLIIRSGLSILADHPRLYWNNGCSPHSEWLRFTPVKIPEGKVWTAKEDARYRHR